MAFISLIVYLLVFPFEGLLAPSILPLLSLPNFLAFSSFNFCRRLQHSVVGWIVDSYQKQYFSLGGLNLDLAPFFCPKNASIIALAKIFPSFVGFEALFNTIGMVAFSLAKLIAMELVAKKTNSKVGGLFEGRVNTFCSYQIIKLNVEDVVSIIDGLSCSNPFSALHQLL